MKNKVRQVAALAITGITLLGTLAGCGSSGGSASSDKIRVASKSHGLIILRQMTAKDL